MTKKLEYWKGEATKYTEWFDATSESSFQNAVSQIRLLNPSVQLRSDLLSVTRMVEKGHLMEAVGSEEKVEVPLGPSRGTTKSMEGSSLDLDSVNP